MRLVRMALAHVAVAITLTPGAARAFDPPVDTAGPLRVRIEGPSEVMRTDTPLVVHVVAENQDERPVEGTVRLGLIDGWRAEPDGAVRLTAGARAAVKLSFRVFPAGDSFSDHYPIHAFARFQRDGRPMTAHPILIVKTKLPARPLATRPLPWAPLKVADNSQLALWQVPSFRAILEVFGKEPRVMPVGWRGTEDRTGASLHLEQPVLAGQSRSVLAMHPPWRDRQVGTVAVEFPLDLPATRPVRLTFANALAAGGRGDGVTFRVRVLSWDAPPGRLGTVVHERHTAAQTWQAAEADLSAFAGRKVRLQLESHPGPKRDTGWDHSYWAEPVLSAGRPAAPPPFPPRTDTGSRVLGTVRRGDRACEVRLWPGNRGLLDAVLGFRDGPWRLAFRGFEVRVPDGRLDDPRSCIVLVEVREEPCSAGCQVRHRFQGAMGTLDLVARLWIEKEVLRAQFRLEKTPPAEPWRVVYLRRDHHLPGSRAAPLPGGREPT